MLGIELVEHPSEHAHAGPSPRRVALEVAPERGNGRESPPAGVLARDLERLGVELVCEPEQRRLDAGRAAAPPTSRIISALERSP